MTGAPPPVPDWRDRTSFLYMSGAVKSGLKCDHCGVTYGRCTRLVTQGSGACCLECRDRATHDVVTIAPARDSVESFAQDTTDAVARLRAVIVELTKIVEEWPK